MNSRERFLACMRFQPVDRVPNWEMGYWAGVLEQWYQEGSLPRHPNAPKGLVAGAGVKGEGFPWRRGEPRDWSVHAHFGLDKGIEKIDGEWGVWPHFEYKVLWEDEENLKYQEKDGTIVLWRKDQSTLPHPVDWPVKDRASWEKLKDERLRIDTAGRLSDDWPKQVAGYKKRDFPLVIGGPPLGVFSILRSLFGFENIMYQFYDDPQLVRDVLSHFSELWLALFEHVLADTDVDYAYFWEDMAYKAGPMVSPRIFREFLMPVYERMNGFFREHGLDITLLDTDGDVWELIPLLWEGGVTGLYPYEVRAGMDIVEVRAKYPRALIIGGIDKNALLEGPEAIDKELERIAPVIKTGGYIPGIDHYVQLNVPWEHFTYYRQRLVEIL